MFFDVAPPRAYEFDQKLTQNVTHNSLLSRDKTISLLLELIDHMLSISEYVFEKH